MEGQDTNSVKKVWKNQTVKIVVVLVLAVGIGLGFFFYRTNYAVASTIWLNGNSGIEIKVNQKEKVLEVNAKDAAAQAIVSGTDFRGSKLDVTINALLGSMMRNGYLKDSMDSITVYVESKDRNRAQELQKELTENVNELLQTDFFRDAKLSQTELTEEELVQLANDYGITVEKVRMIQEIRKQNLSYSFEDLAALPLQELQLLAGQTGLSDFIVSETDGSTKGTEATGKDAYLNEEEAKSIALSHAAVSEEAVVQYLTKLDYENGIMVYEIEFYADGYEYDYEIHATTGEIVSQKKEIDNHYTTSGNHSGAGTHNGTVSHSEIESHNETGSHSEIENHNETGSHSEIESHDETGNHSEIGSHNETGVHSETGTQSVGTAGSNTKTEIGEEHVLL